MKPVRKWTGTRTRTTMVFYTILATSKAEAMRKLRAHRYVDSRSTETRESVGYIMGEARS